MKLKKENNGYFIKKYFFLITLFIGKFAISQPVASFTATPTAGCAPLIVQFTDNSSGNPTSWNWDLGNGTISIKQNPTTTYFNAGTYIVKLTVSNAGGSDSITKTQFITIYDKPVVNFTVTDSLDCVPFTTTFTDLSTAPLGSITSWEWDFDDGSPVSISQNPQHLYNTPGNYNITLKITSPGGCNNTLSKLAFIKASNPILASFRFSNSIKCKPPETISFTNTTTGPGTIIYSWNFGDGGTSTAVNPTHNYLTGGLYPITLIAKNNLGCTDTLLLKDTLLIKNIKSIIISPDTVCLRTPVAIMNGTIPVPLTSLWNFGDGSSGFGINTTKQWNTAGNYTLKLLTNYGSCSDSTTKKITVLTPPIADFTVNDSSSCKGPFTVNFTDLSPGAISWQWDFGDGAISTLKNPSHTYSLDSQYNVKLTITNSFGCSATVTKTKLIKVVKPTVSINTIDGGGCIPYTFKPLPVTTSVDSIVSYFWDFGNGFTSTSQFPTNIYPTVGTYDIKLIITSTDGCIDSAVIAGGVKTGTPLSVNFGVSATLVCPGVNINFTDASVPADEWLWNFGDDSTSIIKNPQHAYSDTGTYSIKLIARNNGCSDSLTKTKLITILPGLARFRPVYNCINKKEVLFKDSSILPQTWFWDFGDGSTSSAPSPVHLFANYQNYTVSLTTTSGSCTNTGAQTITLINEVPNFTVSKDSLCKTDSVFFYLSGFNKSNVTKYVWDFGDGLKDTTTLDSISHQYNIAGLYAVKLTTTDIYGCDETVTKNNFIHVFGPIAGFTINAPGGCLNQFVNFTDTSNTFGSNNIVTWQWNFGDGQSQTFAPPLPMPVTHTYISTGNYYPSLKIIDSKGCSDSIIYAAPVSIYQAVARFFSPNFITCIPDTILFRNPSTGYKLTYLWSFGDGSISTDSLPVKHYTANGDYTVKLVVTDAYGCKDSLTNINYVKLKDVQASFTLSDSVGTCVPLKVDFTNTSLNGTSQLWEFNDGGFTSTNSPSHFYTAPGTYFPKITVNRSNNNSFVDNKCVTTFTKKIVITAPSATLTYSPFAGCAPLSVSFHVSTKDKVFFAWDFNDGTSFQSTDSNQTYTYTSPGKFVPKVYLNDSAGCVIPVIGTDTIRLYSSKVNFGVSDSLVCDAGLISFYDSTISGSAVSMYRWEFGDGSTSAQQNPSHQYAAVGLYTIKLFITTVFGCKDSIVKTNFIKVAVKPQISITGGNTFCGPSLVSFQGNLISSDTSAIRWNWNFGNGNSSLLQTPPAQQYNDTGFHAIQLIASSSSGCTDTAAASVIINAIPNTFAGNDTAICLGSTAQLQATGAASYTWQPAAGLSCTICSNPVASIQNNTTYFVKGTNSNGCEKTDSIFINVKKPFTLTGLQAIDSLCSGDSLHLNVTGAENYSWSPATGLSSTVINNPVASPSVNSTYKVVGFDSSNCFKDSAVIFIKINASPSVNAGPDLVLAAGASATLSPQYSADINNWLWQPPAGLSCSNCLTPVATPANDVTYIIKVTNSSGCTATDDVFIKVGCDNNNLFLPNAFTPNNDGLNDFFYPKGVGVFKILAFKIYNRYGQPVFENGNFFPGDKSAGWDGRYGGKDSPTGNYIYIIEFICTNNQAVNVKGNILLLR